MTQPGLPHGAGPRRSAAAAATPRWAPRGGGGRLRHPCVRRAKGGGCYPADAARGLRSEDGRARKGAPRGPAPGAGQSSPCRTRGNQGLCYPAVGPARARRGLHAQPLPPARAHAHTHGAGARTPAPGPRRPACPPGCQPGRGPRAPRLPLWAPAAALGAHPGAPALPVPSAPEPGAAARGGRGAPEGDGGEGRSLPLTGSCDSRGRSPPRRLPRPPDPPPARPHHVALSTFSRESMAWSRAGDIIGAPRVGGGHHVVPPSFVCVPAPPGSGRWVFLGFGWTWNGRRGGRGGAWVLGGRRQLCAWPRPVVTRLGQKA